MSSQTQLRDEGILTRDAERAASWLLPALCIGAGTLIMYAWFLAAMLRYTHAPSAPLDDAFIHFGYAKSLAHGHFFQWSHTPHFSTGATSTLWPLLLAPGWWLGFRNEAMAYWASGVGALLVGLTAWQGFRLLAFELRSRKWAGFGAAAILTSGGFLWGSLGGMEIGLVSVVGLTMVLHARRAEWRKALFFAALLPLARPEWLASTLVMLVFFWLEQRKGTRRAMAAAATLAPIALYFGIVRLATGHFSTNGAVAKSLFSDPDHGLLWQLGTFAEQLGDLFQSELASLRMLPLFALALAVLAPVVRREARLLAFVTLAGLVATVTTREPFVHANRYQLPAVPMMLVLAVFCLHAIAASIDRRRAVAIGGGLLVLGCNLGAVFDWNDRFAVNCRDIHDQQIAMGHFMHDNLPAGTRVAINDAGAIPLISDLPALDLVGLGSGFPFVQAYREGPGAVFEALEALPPAERPQYFAIYDSWIKLPDLYPERVHWIHLPDNHTCGDPDKILFKADWTWAGTGEQPRTVSGRVVDQVDVANVESEASHRYQVDRPARTLYRREHLTEQRELELADGGRPVERHESLWLTMPSGKTRLVARWSAQKDAHVTITLDGHPVAAVDITAAGDPMFAPHEFTERSIELPEHIGRTHLEIETEPTDAIESFHYWLVQ